MRVLFVAPLAFLLASPALPQSSEGQSIFAKHVQPLLKQKCEGCHGAAQKISGLSVETRESLLRGGTRGPAVLPGDSAKSLLVSALEQAGSLKMPPGQKVDDATLAALKRWIDLGADWSSDAASARTPNHDDVWAFQPLRQPKVPSESGASSPVDAFILRKLQEYRLKPAARADRRTLIRRATYDLTGLPPTPDEVSAYLQDRRSDRDAFAALVDRLLASPRYGERWARHWLDVVRYADTGGYSNDFERPNAWRYRDYVIRSFNRDQPYNQFILEQIAGDEIQPADPEKLVATGFLRMGPWEHTGMSVAALTRQEWLDDVTHTTAASFLGVTMECARCHDHKFDPLPTKDYNRLQAVFAATQFAERPAPFLPGEARSDFKAGRAQLQEMARRNREKLREFDGLIAKRLAEKRSVKIEDLPKSAIAEAIKKRDLLSGEEFERMKVYSKREELYKRSLGRYDPVAYSVSNGKPQETFILPIGNLQTPGEKVTPGLLSVMYAHDVTQNPDGRRLALAQWIASPENPLTVRVIVNRIWQHHFGRGIVATPNDFGKIGKRPTHPELLDWLGSYFLEHGWSVKSMHRVIMLSDAYQQAAKADPSDELFASFQPRRLAAEEIRDSILAVSGELSFDTGGPGTFPEINEDVAVQPQQIMGTLMPAYRPSPARRDRHRRTIFTFQKRNLIDPMIDVFNGPSLNEATAKRDATTVPTQAFTLVNSRFVHEMSLALAARVEKVGGSLEQKIDGAYLLALNRIPSRQERDLALARVRSWTAQHERVKPPERPARKPLIRGITSELTGAEVPIQEDDDPAGYEENLQPGDVSAETRALGDLALVLVNSNEFLYVY